MRPSQEGTPFLRPLDPLPVAIACSVPIPSYSEITLKVFHSYIPLGMCLSAEENAKKIMASHRDASFRRIPCICATDLRNNINEVRKTGV